VLTTMMTVDEFEGDGHEEGEANDLRQGEGELHAMLSQ